MDHAQGRDWSKEYKKIPNDTRGQGVGKRTRFNHYTRAKPKRKRCHCQNYYPYNKFRVTLIHLPFA